MGIELPEQFMEEALTEALKAEAAGEVPVGAVLVVDMQIIARAHNLVETNHDATQHAELLVLQKAARITGNWRLDKAAMFVTLEPCPMCTGAILLSRLPEVYFGCLDPVQGACGSVFDISQHQGLPQKTAVYSGVMRNDCEHLLKQFFRRRRDRPLHTC